jgi:hypothetical protein
VNVLFMWCPPVVLVASAGLHRHGTFAAELCCSSAAARATTQPDVR